MPERENEKISLNRKAAAFWSFVAVLIILLGIFWFWWSNVYLNKDRVFWDMIQNNLATTSITRHISQKGQFQSIDQYSQIQFGANNVAHSVVVLKQGTGANESTVKSETIGTPTHDYNRYLAIDTPQKNSQGKPIDTSGIIGVWAKSSDPMAGQVSSAQFFRQAFLSIAPFAYLSAEQRSDMVKLMQDKKVYDISTGSVKSQEENGRSVYVYEVNINPKAYIEFMEQLAKTMGLGDVGLDASQYEGTQAFKAEFTVNKISRQLVKIKFTASGQEETYTDQGLVHTIDIPTTTIPLADLQKRVEQSVQ